MSNLPKPIAFGKKHKDGWIISAKTAELGPHDEYQTPLYTAPPKREWVGLTDEEIIEVAGDSVSVGECARLIEAKLKEKNT